MFGPRQPQLNEYHNKVSDNQVHRKVVFIAYYGLLNVQKIMSLKKNHNVHILIKKQTTVKKG